MPAGNTGAAGSGSQVLQQPIDTVVSTGNVSSLAIFKQGDDFEVFEERLEQYLTANMVEEMRKVAVLLTLLSEDVYKILRDLCSPDKPSSKDYAILMKLLSEHFKPRLSIYRRIIFDSLKLGQESVNEWYIKVKNTAAQCDFGSKLMYRVQEKFVAGMRPGPILDRLCEEKPSKAFENILEIALDKEAALREQGKLCCDVNKVHKFKGKNYVSDSRSSEKNNKEDKKIEKNKREKEQVELKCNFCNKTNHNFSKCKYLQKIYL